MLSLLFEKDGASSRDYLHVSDLVDGISAAISYESTGCDIFHLASNKETSVSQLVDCVLRVAEKPNHAVEFEKARPGEVLNNCADYDKAHRILKFEPKISLEEGIKQTIQWYLDNKELALSVGESDS